MKSLILGAAGFLGVNLVKKLCESDQELVLFDKDISNLQKVLTNKEKENCEIIQGDFTADVDYFELTKNIDKVYHLISTTIPNNSNNHIAQGIIDNVVISALLLDACVKNKVKKIIFLSSGGTVYGVEKNSPFSEETATNPISAYGLQKITIEKLLYLYHYMHGLDYSIVRLANPYGRYQRPNGIQGVVTTFIYNELLGEPITVYGDGSVVRDFIYIDDAIKAICNISNYSGELHVFNVGTGIGYSINQVIEAISNELGKKVYVEYKNGRAVDVPVNILDISRYKNTFGTMNITSLKSGIRSTIEFMKNSYA